MIGMMANILMATICALTAPGGRHDVALVKAELKNVHYEREIESNGGDVMVGAWFSARVRIKHDLIGHLPGSSRDVSIVMTSAPLPSLYRGREVYLLVKNVKARTPVVIAWDYVDTGLCIPRAMAERYSIAAALAGVAGSASVRISGDCPG